MGRITIFTLVDCPHCIRTKKAFKDRSIPYVEISLSSYPSKRTDMLQLADRLTVPQVFFNEQHIGGADDTIRLIQSWDLQKYEAEVASQPDPTDSRLEAPTTPAETTEEPMLIPRDRNELQLPSGTSTSVLEVTQTLRRILKPRMIPKGLTSHHDVFHGSELKRALAMEYTTGNTEAFALRLLQQQVVQPVSAGSGIQDLGLYRLQCHHTPFILNSYRIWPNDWGTTNPVGLVKRLKGQLSKILAAHTDASTGTVNYKAAYASTDMPSFEEASCELQSIDWKTMDSDTTLAFGMNLYNLMIRYAFCKVGIATRLFSRAAFFAHVSFNIGGHILSFNDLENGVLRGNRAPPFSYQKPFKATDTRLELALANPDPRIHFGLNCGAKSCPPVKNFTAKSIQEELRIVALAFCEQDDNLRVANGTLYLSSIFHWYRQDFGGNAGAIPEAVLPYLRGDKKESLQKLIDSGNKVLVKFLTYDWSTDASEFAEFKPATLAPKHNLLRDLLC